MIIYFEIKHELKRVEPSATVYFIEWSGTLPKIKPGLGTTSRGVDNVTP